MQVTGHESAANILAGQGSQEPVRTQQPQRAMCRKQPGTSSNKRMREINPTSEMEFFG